MGEQLLTMQCFTNPNICSKTRHYLRSNKSTSLDKAGRMIDKAQEALNHAAYVSVDVTEARHFAIDRAEQCLGNRDSVGVRRALRNFWDLF